MITEKDLIEAIAECQGQRNPNANTCIKLAAFYTILDHIREKQEELDPQPSYSYSAPPDLSVITYRGDSDFAEAINDMDTQEIWPIMDELMDTLSVVNPRLYRSVMRKVKGE